MKKTLALLTLALLAIGPSWARAQAGIESDPAYLPIDKAIDLKTIHPEVNVNLPKFLLQDALADLNGGPDDPFASAGVNLADLTKDVKLIRFMVIDAGDANRAALSNGIAALRKILETKWTPVATVPEENVGVYAIGDASGEALAGLAVLVHDGDDAVIGNIVGRISLGKVIKVASRFDKFPKDLLKKLMGEGGEKPKMKSEEKAKKSDK